MTCNAEYESGNEFAKNVEIKNYYGDNSITVRDVNKMSMKWDFYENKSPPNMQYFIYNPVNKAFTYNTKTKEDKCWQSCGARYKLWSTKNGKAEDVELNLTYWKAKEGPGIMFKTGFRIWTNKDNKQLAKA